METEEYTKEEMEKLRAEEKGMPIVSRWFKHKEKAVYKKRLNLFEDMPVYEEV